ncbi:MAG: TetR/AcrR family transcriptional regulator [Clostridiaceae bacterium]|nr:TetR/AcrR family transcriptional regulator [Eubacteriales bacterium]
MPRSKWQNEQARDARRVKIRASALRQFALKGLGAARIQDIAAEIGMAQGLLYHYYPSKEALYLDLAQGALDKTIETVEAVQGMRGKAHDKLLYLMRILTGTIEQDESYAQTLCLLSQSTAPLKLSDEDRNFLEEKRLFPYHVLAELFHEGQSEGSVEDGEPMDFSLLFWSLVTGLALHRTTYETPFPMPDHRILATMFLKNPAARS